MDETGADAVSSRRRHIGPAIVGVPAALVVGTTTGISTAMPIDSQEQMARPPDGDIHVVSSGTPDAAGIFIRDFAEHH
ncbi:hypothetical protein [Nocardia araoensis]|uniref:hypothetical protein n=1 Tax=Nocardia araoensis TaxID=228600 RepID=UPI0002E7D024|nr:hypothetical protein [Nocardia araoensis]